MSESLNGRRILVTGGAGQLGAALVSSLLSEGARVLVLDRQSPGTLPSHPAMEYHQCDLSDTETVRATAVAHLQCAEHLVHLAATVNNEPPTAPQVPLDFQADVLGTASLLNALPGLRAICYTSSIMVYGQPQRARINEEHPIEPQNSYGILKLATENVLRMFARRTSCPVAILRLSGIYGASLGGSRAIPAFIRCVLNDEPPVVHGGGLVERDYLYIDDAVEALRLAVTQRADGVFNIGTGQGTTTLALAEAVIRSAGKQLVPVQREDAGSAVSQHSLVYDVTKAGRVLGFRCRYDIDRGMKRLIDLARHQAEAGSVRAAAPA